MPRQTTLLEVEADLAAGRRQLLGLLAERCTLKSATVKAKYRTRIDTLADELRRLEAQRDEAERLQVLAWLDGADVPEPAGPLVIVD